MNVDGLKTGHTSGAGFNLIASAVETGSRLIAVVMGADSAKGREEEALNCCVGGSRTLLRCKFCSGAEGRYGSASGTAIKKISPGTEQDFWMVLPKAEIPHIKAKYTLDG